MIHEGGFPTGSYNYDAAPGAGDGISGPIVDIAKRLTPKVDMVITGHTHQPYVCNIPDPKGQPRLVTSAIVVRPDHHRDELQATTDRTGDIIRKSEKAVNHLRHP